MNTHPKPAPKPLSVREILERPDGKAALPQPTVRIARIGGIKIA